MRKIPLLLAASLVALGGAARAADDPARPAAKPTLATATANQLRQADVPSVTTDPNGAQSVKAKADADMAARDARSKGPRLQVTRQNLKGDAAKREIQAHTNPNTIDHDTAYGDKDHTEQVTDFQLHLKK